MSNTVSKHKDVIYVFRKCKDNISLADKGKFPKLFYSYFEVKKLLDASFIDAFEELERLSYPNRYIRYIKAKSGISENFAYFSREAIDKMNNARVVYATTDGLALSLADMKKKQLLKTKIVINSMGLFDHPIYLDKIGLLDHVDSIIVFSFPLVAKLGELGHSNVHFVRYGTDIDFYAPRHCEQLRAESDNPVILGIGLDRKRDWDRYKQVSLELNRVEFRVIAPDSLKKGFEGFSNINFFGNVSYLKTREEICTADALFLPTEENIYFSGQSTLFNALAMKKPVVMPYDANFEEYGLDRTLFYDRECPAEDIVNLLKLAIGKDTEIMKSVEFNHHLVRQEYNQIDFARRLKDVLS